VQVSQESPEVPRCVEAHQQDDKQAHKLDPDGPGEVHARQQQPQPPGSTERSGGKTGGKKPVKGWLVESSVIGEP